MTAAHPTVEYRPATPDQLSHARLRLTGWGWVAVAAGVVALVTIGSLIGAFVRPVAARTCIPGPSCSGTPPLSPPLSPAKPFKSTSLGFSFDENPSCGNKWKEQDRSPHGVSVVIDGVFPIKVQGLRAGTKTPADLVDDVAKAFPAARDPVYDIPGAELGYVQGSGRVYDYNVTSSGSTSLHLRSVIIAAVRHGIGVTLASYGPFVENTLDNYGGHPNPAATPMTTCLREIISTITWPGDPTP